MSIVSKTKPVSRNMQELYAVATSEKHRGDLIANPWGTKLYYAKGGWGVIWRIFYCLWALFFGTTLRHKSLKKALIKTEKLFKALLNQIEDIADGYKKNLTACLEEEEYFRPTEFAKYRWLITQWNDLTKPFLKLIHFKENRAIQSLWHRYYGWNRTKSLSEYPFHCLELYHELRSYQHLINIERILQVETPLVPLRRLSQEKMLSKEQKKQITQWVKVINQNQNKLTVRRLHKGLRALVSHITKYQWKEGLSKPDIAAIEVALAKEGCGIFKNEDPKHLEWRSSLKEGSALRCNEYDVDLETKLGEEKLHDGFHVYTEKENPDIVVVIGKNPAVLGIKKKLADDYAFGIMPAEWFEVDEEGTCAIVERLRYPLSTFPWSKGEVMTEKDLELAAPVIGQIKWCLNQKVTPLNFKEQYLAFNKQLILKSRKVSLEGPLDYPALEAFALGCACQQQKVFKYLMEQSGLMDHPYKKYYNEVVEMTLKDEIIDLVDLAAFHPHRIDDPLATEQAKKLQKELNSLKERCIKAIQEKHHVADDEALYEHVVKSIGEFYRKYGTTSILWPTMEEDVIKRVTEKMDLGTHESLGVLVEL